MQDHHALNFGSSFAVQLVYRYDNKWRPYESHHSARIRIKPASLAVSSSFTYNTLETQNVLADEKVCYYQCCTRYISCPSQNYSNYFVQNGYIALITQLRRFASR